MIKGIYVAQVRIDIAVDENSPGLLPFDQMQKALREQTTEAVKDLLEDELFGDVGTVTVEQQWLIFGKLKTANAMSKRRKFRGQRDSQKSGTTCPLCCLLGAYRLFIPGLTTNKNAGTPLGSRHIF